jgi:alpha-L-fucosidase 2
MSGHSLKHNIVLQSPIERWDEAIPLGNGLLGVLLWGDSSQIRFSLDRGDLWDLRVPPEYKQADFNWHKLNQLVADKNIEEIREKFDTPYSKYPYPTKIPAGRIELLLKKGDKSRNFSLDLKRALGVAAFDKGTIESFVCADSHIGMIRLRGIDGTFRLRPPPFGETLTGESGHVANLGYPKPLVGRSKSMQWFLQECAEGFKYAVVIGQKRIANGDCEAAFAITCTNDGDDPLHVGQMRVEEALEKSFDKLFDGHKRWWRGFWSKSSVSIPDPLIERHYYLVQYFYGAASRRGMPAMPLQGLWTADEGKLPPWKGDYHNDLNTQMSYWAYLTANHLDEGACFLDFLWDRFDAAKKFARDFYGTGGACYPGVMDFNGQPLCGWPQYSLSPTNSAWLAHNFYLHWRYTLDKDFLVERTYPVCRAIAQCLVELLKPDEKGILKLPLSTSPEVHDDQLCAWIKPNSNYDLALIRWLLAAVAEMAMELGIDADVTWSKSVLDKLDELAVEETSFDGSSRPGSLKISQDESLTASHRHFSHMMTIHPLGTLHVEGTDYDRSVINASLRHLDMLGTGLWVGFSFSWMACMAARCGKPDRALTMLELFLKGFVSRNGFNLNGDYKQLGLSSWNYRPFTLEANFAAAQAVNEMLLQSWNGIIRIFPAIPADWNDVSFEHLRAEGAFIVSAKRENGRTIWVRIVAERGGIIRLRDPFGKVKIKWNRADIKRKGDEYTCIMAKNECLEGRII